LIITKQAEMQTKKDADSLTITSRVVSRVVSRLHNSQIQVLSNGLRARSLILALSII